MVSVGANAAGIAADGTYVDLIGTQKAPEGDFNEDLAGPRQRQSFRSMIGARFGASFWGQSSYKALRRATPQSPSGLAETAAAEEGYEQPVFVPQSRHV